MRRLARSVPGLGFGLSAHGLTETRAHIHRMRDQIDQLRDQATPQELAQMQSVIENYARAASAQFGISIVPGLGAMASDMGLNLHIQSLDRTFQQLHQQILQNPQALTEAAIRSAAMHAVREGRLPPSEFERVRNSIQQQYHSGNPDTRAVVDNYKRFISDDIRAVGQNLAELRNIRSQQRISGLEVEDAPNAAMASLSAPTFSGRNGHHAFVASV